MTWTKEGWWWRFEDNRILERSSISFLLTKYSCKVVYIAACVFITQWGLCTLLPWWTECILEFLGALQPLRKKQLRVILVISYLRQKVMASSLFYFWVGKKVSWDVDFPWSVFGKRQFRSILAISYLGQIEIASSLFYFWDGKKRSGHKLTFLTLLSGMEHLTFIPLAILGAFFPVFFFWLSGCFEIQGRRDDFFFLFTAGQGTMSLWKVAVHK